MRPSNFTALRQTGSIGAQRRARILTLGLAILTGLALSGAVPDTASPRQGFSDVGPSLSLMPETVRLRTTP